jgi:hypothetical protein
MDIYRDRDRSRNPTGIYADWSDTPRKFVQRGLKPHKNLFRVARNLEEISLGGYDSQ